jgi:high-affinity nickel-transport protein
MAKAYSWAFTSPIRKVFYNLTMTSLSVFVALFIGTVELMQVLIERFDLKGGVFGAIAGFDLIGRAGYFIVVAFVLAWIAALLIYKARRIDERWSEKVSRVA